MHTAYNPSPLHRNRLGAIVQMLSAGFPDPSQATVLEVGCGMGNICTPLASLGYNVHGIDIHQGSVDAARSRTQLPNIHFDAVDLREVDLSKYDAVILSEVLEHVPEAEKMLSFLASNLKPGSLLILTVPNGWSLLEMACRPSYFLKRFDAGVRVVKAIKKILGSKDLTTADAQTPHVQFFRLSRLHRLFAERGLEVGAFYSFFFAWPLWEIFFTERRSEKWAKRDFVFSKCLPASLHTVWCFGLFTASAKSPFRKE